MKVTDIPHVVDQDHEKLECGSSLAETEHDVLNHRIMNLHIEDKDPSPPSSSTTSSISDQIDRLRDLICRDIVGDEFNITQTPFLVSPFENPHHKNITKNTTSNDNNKLKVPLIYCDHTASSRPLKSIERYIEKKVLQMYGNTHTNTSFVGSQSTAFVSEARQIIAESTNARITGKASSDVVLFTQGSGATSAVQLLIETLVLPNMNESDIENEKPVVFVGPYEHHSNLVPWRESGCQIVNIPEKCGNVDLNYLEEQLIHFTSSSEQQHERLLMGTFSAASNVTGKTSDTIAIAKLLHKYKALAFFDYATGAPYLNIDMNPTSTESSSSAHKDAIFISPHKMMGGINTCGILIMKKQLVNQIVPPKRSGGGTVFYVTNTHHRFLSNRIERYEGGTPNIVGIVRAGLTFLYKRKIHQEYERIVSQQKQHQAAAKRGHLLVIQENNENNEKEKIPNKLIDYEFNTYNQIVNYLQREAPNLILLGGSTSPSEESQPSSSNHLPIFSFLIKCGSRFLHYNYVCALLNDLFGIQTRGGCQCAGPYSQRLLGLTEHLVASSCEEIPNEFNQKIEYALLSHKEKAELLRPGYTRLSLPFKGLRSMEVQYVLKALVFISQSGWIFMPQYRCNHRTGEWRHHHRKGKPLGDERRWLSHYDPFLKQEVKENESSFTSLTSLQELLDSTFKSAELLLEKARRDKMNIAQSLKANNPDNILGQQGGEDLDNLASLRWYVYPKECAEWLKEDNKEDKDEGMILGPIQPNKIPPIIMKQQHDELQSNNHNNNNDTSYHHQSSSIEEKKEEEAQKIIYYFRDGEYHSGEAPLCEIEDGYNDGELSDACEILDNGAQGDWVSLKDFLENKNKASSHTTTTTNNNTKTSSSQVQQEKMRNAMTVSGTQRKKPARDSSTWGQQPQQPQQQQQKSITKNDMNVTNSASATVVSVSTNSSVNNKKKSFETEQPVSVKATQNTSKEIKQKEQSNNTTNNKKIKKKKKGWDRPPPKMMRLIIQAVIQFNMIENGDRLLLGLSGGKDSLSLLQCLLELKRKLPIQFDIEVCTIDPMTPSFDPSPLIPYVENTLKLKYHYIRDDIVERARSSGKEDGVVSSLCAFCARMKRGNLYTVARRNNCNKLVLAQHLDDCAESLLMSMMHNGFLRSMKAHYKINAGDLSVIRPMVYCREALMTEYAKFVGLPIINENCPACFEEPKERDRVKKLLAREETLHPTLFDNLRRAMIPLLHEDSTSIMRAYTEETVAKSRKIPGQRPIDRFIPQLAQTMAQKMKEEKSTTMSNNSEEEEEETKKKSSSDLIVEKTRSNMLLSEANENELLAELARRKASNYRLYGANKRLGQNEDELFEDSASKKTENGEGMMCSIQGNSRDGAPCIPCYELME